MAVKLPDEKSTLVFEHLKQASRSAQATVPVLDLMVQMFGRLTQGEITASLDTIEARGLIQLERGGSIIRLLA